MREKLAELLREDHGEDLIEYGLLAAFVAAVAAAAIISDPLGLKPALVAAFNKAKTALSRV